VNRRSFLVSRASTIALAGVSRCLGQSAFFRGQVPDGPFLPFWESLKSYRCPDWFRDAKFGIWAHWSPQCVPEQGDWYARNMYIQGSGQYQYHVKQFGHPSQFGYKDICQLQSHVAPKRLVLVDVADDDTQRICQQHRVRYFVAEAAIGSGKTQALILPPIRQLFTYSANDPERKLSGIVLEVKGYLCRQLQSISTAADAAHS
jgi:Alpha-L-fucosidase